MEKEMKVDANAQHTACDSKGCNQEMDYGQLRNIAIQLSAQNQELRKQVQELDMANFFKRLDYLWDIIHSTSPYLSEEFKVKSGREYMEMMAKPEVPEETTDKE